LPDTLIIDSVQIAQWQAQRDFDYNREMVGGGMTFTEWLWMKINELLEDIFGNSWDGDYKWWLLSAAGLVIVGVGIWYVRRYHPNLFKKKEDEQDYDGTEDTIYGVDFDTAVSQAVGHEDYREAVRLVYLRTLKVLSDRHQIDWQPFKTPSQYVREYSAVPAFRTLTAHFLRVRYGNFPATRVLYDEVENLGKEVSRES
jgi:hypothetical protein